MKSAMRNWIIVVFSMFFLLGFIQSAWSQAKGHASVGMGRGEEGYLALQEMVKRLEFSLKMNDASPKMKIHLNFALKHAKEAMVHYDEALKHTNESLGRTARNPLESRSGSDHEGSQGGQDHHAPPPSSGPPMGMPEGSQHDGGHSYPQGPPMGMPEGSHH
ncbi:MAG: hypothetical protein ACQ9MH_06880 [Nitrospinales bacterium]